MGQEFSDYDLGYRAGTFDRCNGRPCLISWSSDSLWDSGYTDGWESNESKFPCVIVMAPAGSDTMEEAIEIEIEHIEAMTQDMSRDAGKIMFDISEACKRIRGLLKQG